MTRGNHNIEDIDELTMKIEIGAETKAAERREIKGTCKVTGLANGTESC